MQRLRIVGLLALGVGFVASCGGGDTTGSSGGSGAVGTGGADAEDEGDAGSGGDEGAAGNSSALAGAAGESTPGGETTGGADAETGGASGAGGDCAPGSLSCPCYGNDTCDAPLRCEDGTCRPCEDGTLGCPCYGNGTCNAGLTCEDDVCAPEEAGGTGGTTGTGGQATTGGATTGGTEDPGSGGAPDGGTGGGTGGAGGNPAGGTGGQAQAGAPATGGAAGSGGATMCASTCSDPNVIDDFEDGDIIACPRQNWTIDWWTDGDEYGYSVPTIETKEELAVTLDTPRDTSCGALHLEGYGFSDWGVEIGLTFNNPTKEMPLPVDLSAYQGVAFWVRGTGSVQVQLPTIDTLPPEAGGVCSGEWPDCWDYFESGFITLTSTWTRHEIDFASLANEYEGATPTATDLRYVLNLFFYLSIDTTFDLWLDDVSFY